MSRQNALGDAPSGCGSASGYLPRPWFPFWQGYKSSVGREGLAAAWHRGAGGMALQRLAAACSLLALCLATTGATTNPGFVVRITQAGLDYGGFGFCFPSLQVCWCPRGRAGSLRSARGAPGQVSGGCAHLELEEAQGWQGWHRVRAAERRAEVVAAGQ